jgi:hypothetical protein
MPHFRKLSDAETAASQPTLSVRAQVAQAYDALLADVAISAYGRAELVDGERRTVVRSRLHAAALVTPAAMPPAFMVEAASMPDRAAAPRVTAPRRRREERRSAGRYDAVLPRWMRAEQPAGRRDQRRTT